MFQQSIAARTFQAFKNRKLNYNASATRISFTEEHTYVIQGTKSRSQYIWHYQASLTQTAHLNELSKGHRSWSTKSCRDSTASAPDSATIPLSSWRRPPTCRCSMLVCTISIRSVQVFRRSPDLLFPITVTITIRRSIRMRLRLTVLTYAACNQTICTYLRICVDAMSRVEAEANRTSVYTIRIQVDNKESGTERANGKDKQKCRRYMQKREIRTPRCQRNRKL